MSCAYSPEPKEIMFHAVDYKNEEAIKGLLRFYYEFKVQAKESMNTELICIYTDIDKALKNIEMTRRQRIAVAYYKQGWIISDIGREMGISHQAVHKLVMKVVRKISEYLCGGDSV